MFSSPICLSMLKTIVPKHHQITMSGLPLIVCALLAFVAPGVFGGSLCPPRTSIYPCTCANVFSGKKPSHTIITCHQVVDSAHLASLLNTLSTLDVDQLHLYDSLWGESEGKMPSDWTSLLRAKELAVVDSTLSQCFACQFQMGCSNSVTTSLSVTNSSTAPKICGMCDIRGQRTAWTGCLQNLRHFRFTHGKLSSLGGADPLFPDPMRQLLSLDLSHNRIVKVDSNAFKNLPRLTSLDLSYNAIEFLDHVFAGRKTTLHFLDVSWNNIKSIGADLFASLPALKTFSASSNAITDLKEAEWKSVPKSLRSIDLSDNPLNCDCAIRWINSTFAVHVALAGTCATPADYENSAVRRASRFLTERCDGAGNIGSRPRSHSRRKATTRRSRA